MGRWCRNRIAGGFGAFPRRSGDPPEHRHAETGHDIGGLQPCAEIACMLFFLGSAGQRPDQPTTGVDGWDILHIPPTDRVLDLAA
jgi:hypothetical protein